MKVNSFYPIWDLSGNGTDGGSSLFGILLHDAGAHERTFSNALAEKQVAIARVAPRGLPERLRGLSTLSGSVLRWVRLPTLRWQSVHVFISDPKDQAASRTFALD